MLPCHARAAAIRHCHFMSARWLRLLPAEMQRKCFSCLLPLLAHMLRCWSALLIDADATPLRLMRCRLRHGFIFCCRHAAIMMPCHAFAYYCRYMLPLRCTL